MLGTWCPWDSPGTHLLQAIAHVQRLRDASTDRVDMNAMCMRRAEAITELAYEQEHLKCLPQTLQYQKLARLRLGDCTRWHRRDQGKLDTSRILSICASVRGVSSLISVLESSECARHQRARERFGPVA